MPASCQNTLLHRLYASYIVCPMIMLSPLQWSTLHDRVGLDNDRNARCYVVIFTGQQKAHVIGFYHQTTIPCPTIFGRVPQSQLHFLEGTSNQAKDVYEE